MGEFDHSYHKTAAWLLESFKVNNYLGSSAWSSRFFHPVRNWSYPYPETTGYTIPTIYDYLSCDPPEADEWSKCIHQSVRWLLSLQLTSGAFPGGHAADDGSFYLSTSDYLLGRGHPPTPSVFNSGQILRGLARHYRETADAPTLKAIEACAGFLLGSIRDDGTWAPDAYAGSSSPSYFVYVTSSLLAARDLLPNEDEIVNTALTSLERVIALASERTGFIGGMGFGARDIALTHTIGYTLAGLLESARTLDPGGKKFAKRAITCLEAIRASLGSHDALPGTYMPGWAGDRTFTCVTGNCQLALCFLDASDITGNGGFRDVALKLCRSAAKTQRASGGFPGSYPIHGKYMRLRCPNWAAKYYMDLVARLRAGWSL